MQTYRARLRREVRRPVTLLGDLISAIYEAFPGSAEFRSTQTARVLTSAALARRLTPRIRLVG